MKNKPTRWTSQFSWYGGRGQVSLPTDSAGTTQSHFDSKSITLGAQLAGTVGSQITRAYDTIVESTQTDNDRLAGALALKGAYDAAKLASSFNGQLAQAQAASDAAAAQGVTDPNASAFGVSVTLGTSKSSFDSTQGSTTQHGTVVQASNIQITATEGDVTGIGTKLYATGNVSLEAARLVNLGAAQNTSVLDQQSNSSSAGVGVTFGFGQQNGISFQAGASNSEGNAQGTQTTWDNALVTAGGTLSVKSGGDTNLIGAQLVGSTVKTDIGGKLNIETLQDTSNYQSEQTSSGWGVSLRIPPLCYGTSSVSVNSAQQSIDHSYRSATGQSGIAAGEGGLQMSVTGTTNLIGGAITSQAAKEMNTLSTAGITYTDLTNTQNTSASSSSFNVSSSASAVSNLTGNVLGNLAGQAGLPGSGSQAGATLSVISPANITITGSDAQSQENVATLTSRDATTANGSLVNTLTLDQAQQLQEEIRQAQQNARAAQLIGAVIDTKIGDIAAQKDWAEGSWQKTALHGLSGAVQAAIGGGNIAAGAFSGALNEQLVPVIEAYLDSHGVKPFNPDGSPNSAYRDLLLAGSALAGAAVGAVAAGPSGASTGGSVAVTATAFNRLLHPVETQMISANAERFAQQLYGTDKPTPEQIQGATALLANTAQHELDNNLGAAVPYSKVADDFLQQLKTEYQQKNGSLVLPGTSGQQYLFYATVDQKNFASLNQGLADPAVTGLIVRTPLQPAINNPTSDPSRDRLTGLALDAQGRYTVQMTVQGTTYAPKYFPCGAAACVAEGSNLDRGDPQTQSFLRAVDKMIMDDINNGATIATLAFGSGVVANFANVLGPLTSLGSGLVSGQPIEAASKEAIQFAATQYLQRIYGFTEAAANRVAALVDLSGGWRAFVDRAAAEINGAAK